MFIHNIDVRLRVTGKVFKGPANLSSKVEKYKKHKLSV